MEVPHFLMAFLASGAVLIGGIATWYYRSKQQVEAARSFLAGAQGDARAAFKAWRASTADDDSTGRVEWNGATSEVLWMQLVPLYGWRVWAQSGSGRFFQLDCLLHADPLRIVASSAPREVAERDLQSAMAEARRAESLASAGANAAVGALERG